MNAGAKLGAYGLVLAAALGGGAAVGAAAGPIDVDDAPAHHMHDDGPTTPDHDADGDLPSVGGLVVADSGYRLLVEDRLADKGEFAFTIEGPDGDAVTAFDVEHDKRLHLIVASRDLETFEHVHPELDETGRWSIELPDLPAGPYRAFADFHPTGADKITLGIDLVSPGQVEAPTSLRTSTSDRVDGYDVELTGELRPGSTSTATIAVERDGDQVETDPYLGARGHLVALRDGDLAYLHVHPLPDQDDGSVRFSVEFPSAGTYALFFDFAHDGAVHTARFVVDTGRPSPDQPTTEQPTTDAPEPGDDGSEHGGGDAGHAHD